MKDKLNKRIEATGNHQQTQHLLRIALAMKIQGHDSLPYNMSPQEVFFGRKYWQRPNSLATIRKQQEIITNVISNHTIDTRCKQPILNPTLADILYTHLEYKVDDETHMTEGENEEGMNCTGQQFFKISKQY